MSKSLAEQLLGAGLVDEKKVKKAKQEKRKAKKQARSGIEVETDDSHARIEQHRQAQIERDRELNKQRKAAEEEKELRAQAIQMLQQHQQECAGDIRFNFVDKRTNKVKNIDVSSHAQRHLINGNLAICALENSYVVVPKNIADKIAERFSDALMHVADQVPMQADEDDPYKDYQVPDDLMW